MGPTEAVSSVFRNYINFRGRAQRSEFWWFALFHFIVSVVLGLIALGLPAISFLEWVYSLGVLLPSLAVTARRLHDTGRSALWLLIYLGIFLAWIIGGIIWGISVGIDDPEILESDPREWPGYATYIVACILISLAGAVTLLILCAMPGTPGANRYGPDPLRREPGIIVGYGYRPDAGQPYAPSRGDYGGDAAPASEPGGQRYCPQCGAERQEDAQFCAVCGSGF